MTDLLLSKLPTDSSSLDNDVELLYVSDIDVEMIASDTAAEDND